MILSDRHLRHALGIGPPIFAEKGSAILDAMASHYVDRGCLKITPELEPVQIQPASIDLRLGPEVTRFEKGFGYVDAVEGIRPEDLIREDRGEAGYLTIRRGEFLLGHTLETIVLPPYLTGRVEGRSSLGRLGVTMHVTAGYIDPGFDGQITLEIKNLSDRDVRIPIGHRVCQIVIETMSSPAELPYGAPGRGSRYQGQTGATPYTKADE